VESVQFDWSTLRVGPVSNGVANVEYNLSVTGTFNNNPDTVIHIDFGLDKSDSIPNMSGIRMNQPPRISRGKVLEIYE
jgi:lipoprotein